MSSEGHGDGRADLIPSPVSIAVNRRIETSLPNRSVREVAELNSMFPMSLMIEADEYEHHDATVAGGDATAISARREP